jgi:hypothetical protein
MALRDPHKRGRHKKSRRQWKSTIDRRYYLKKKRLKRQEKVQNSIDKYVFGKDVTSSNIYTYKEYCNLVRCYAIWKIHQHNTCKEQKTEENSTDCNLIVNFVSENN